jgi:serine-type D-Ala-D-Ala carboxypeptidase/endopeptidase (penicillin-binding protein 4)
MREALFILAGGLLLAGCSISGRIARQAQTEIIKDSSLLNAHAGICIFDPSSGKYLYEYQAEKYFVPASNTKLATCYVIMKHLGDSLPALQYMEKNNSYVIKGTGDPSFLSAEFKFQPAWKFLLASEGKMEWDTSNWKDQMLGSGWSWSDYEETYMAPRSLIPVNENSFRVELQPGGKLFFSPSFFRKMSITNGEIVEGINVNRQLNSNEITISPGRRSARELSFHADPFTTSQLLSDSLKKEIVLTGYQAGAFQTIYSQPLDSLLKPMMHRSDNFFAEQSLLMVSNKILGYMNDAAIIDSFLKSDYKDLPQMPRWVDGSGLSRYNLFSPRDLVSILTKMKNEFGMERLKVIMATGDEGTLAGRYKNEKGYIYAKTGTLAGVVALSGFIYTKKHKLLIFSFLVNNYAGSATPVRDAIEKFITHVRNEY